MIQTVHAESFFSLLQAKLTLWSITAGWAHEGIFFTKCDNVDKTVANAILLAKHESDEFFGLELRFIFIQWIYPKWRRKFDLKRKKN